MATLIGWLIGSVTSCSDGAKETARVELCDVQPIYAATYLAHRRESVARVCLRNGAARASGPGWLTVDLGESERLLARSWVVPVDAVPAGGELSVSLVPPLSAKILDEPSRELPITVSWTRRDGEVLSAGRGSLRVLESGYLSWDEPERVGAYVRADEDLLVPLVLAASRRALRQGASPVPFVGRAASVFEALRDLGLHYLGDPSAPHAVALADRPLDRVRYPGETLRDGVGDCDDLAVLLAAAFEAASLPAALVVGEDHVLCLVDSGVDILDLEAAPLPRERLVVVGDRLWIPLEATLLTHAGSGFLEAWAEGAGERSAIEAAEARLVIVRDAWQRFPPPPRRPHAEPRARDDAHGNDLAGGRKLPAVSRELERVKEFLRRTIEARAAAARERHAAEPLVGARQAARVFARAGFHDAAVALLESHIGSPPPAGASRTSELDALEELEALEARLELASYRLAACQEFKRRASPAAAGERAAVAAARLADLEREVAGILREGGRHDLLAAEAGALRSDIRRLSGLGPTTDRTKAAANGRDRLKNDEVSSDNTR